MESLDSSEENHENSFMILKAAEQARGLVRQLMAFSRKEELVTRSVNIGNLVEDMVKMLSRLIGEHIEIETKIHLSNVGVMADSGQLEQALVNLCLNAKDAMPGGGKLTISAGITRLELEDCSIHADATPGEYALISIQDTGRGIPKEFLEHIFEPFFTTKDLGKGTGLGLATVYAIVNRHDGFLRVDSEEDIGTVFSMYLPIAEDVFTDGKPEESHINVKGGSETVLLAEDEPMVRNFASRILQRAGYKVVEAVDGEEAINLFVSNGGEIDMLVFDVMMPRKNGRDAYNEIEKLHKDIPVLFCSGYGDDLLKTEYNVDVGGRILPKPYKSRELLREVRLILDRMGSNSIKPQL
jgi:CheY-like chemotaxis protein